MKIFLCDETPESMLTAVYDAFADPVKNSDIRIQITKEEQFDFLNEYERVEASYEKAEKVMTSIEKKLGFRTFVTVQGAISAAAPDRADAVFRFLQYAFRKKYCVLDELQAPEVMRVFELNRKSRNEAHLLTGFIRFEELDHQVFFSKIAPVNDVLPLLADHFAERFNTQAFMIYDEKRKKSVVYVPGENWYFVEGEVSEKQFALRRTDRYEVLWKAFFDAVTIKERMNPVCQRNHCPIHFRKYMTEFVR